MVRNCPLDFLSFQIPATFILRRYPFNKCMPVYQQSACQLETMETRTSLNRKGPFGPTGRSCQKGPRSKVVPNVSGPFPDLTSNRNLPKSSEILAEWKSPMLLVMCMSIFVPDTTVTSRNVQVIWNPLTMHQFMICACFYSGLLLKNPSVRTLVAAAEIRTSNLSLTRFI